MAALAMLAVLSLPSTALAAPRALYLTNYWSPGAVSLFTIGAGGQLSADGSVGAGDGANLMAMTPNGRYAYVTTGAAVISQYDVEANGALVPMSTSGVSAPNSYGITVSPNGKQVYVTGPSSIAIFDVGATGALTPNPVQPSVSTDLNTPLGLAMTPNGRSLYVANAFGSTSGLGDLTQFSVASNGTLTPKSTAEVSTGIYPQNISITPNGKFAYVSNSGNGSVSNATVSEYSIGGDGSLTQLGSAAPAGAASSPIINTLRVSPNGKSLYVPNQTAVFQFRIASNGTLAADSPASISAGSGLDDIWLSADGKSAYAVDYTSGPGSIFEFNVSSAGLLSFKPTNKVAAGNGPSGALIAPDQAPIASFSARRKGKRLTLNAGRSRAPDGTVVSYHWSFGDGRSATTKSPKIKHRYRRARKYKVTLTVTDDAGCSTKLVYTGQSANCNGGPSAVHAKRITA